MGVQAGSIGPIGLDLPLLVDASAATLASFVCGANEDGYHYLGANWSRDVGDAIRSVDMRDVEEGDQAADGSGPLKFMRGIEVGHIFKLGTKYTRALKVSIQDADGSEVAPIMGCYGFGVSRCVAAVVEQCHDADGIVWPDAVAPFDVHIVALNNTNSIAVAETAEALHRELQASGLAVLLDDRDERPGVKFADADLIGIPHRITVGDRGLKAGAVEFRRRASTTVTTLPAERCTRCDRSGPPKLDEPLGGVRRRPQAVRRSAFAPRPGKLPAKGVLFPTQGASVTKPMVDLPLPRSFPGPDHSRL